MSSQFSTQEEEAWQARLDDARNSQYSDLKASADQWASNIGLLIGAVGSISIILVPKALTDFSSNTARDWALVFAIAAGFGGLVALGTAVWVSLGWPKVDARMDAIVFGTQTISKTASGVTLLQISRWAALGALLCLVTASSISAADTLSASTSPVQVLIVHKDGTATCGSLDVTTYKDVAQATVVAQC